VKGRQRTLRFLVVVVCQLLRSKSQIYEALTMVCKASICHETYLKIECNTGLDSKNRASDSTYTCSIPTEDYIHEPLSGSDVGRIELSIVG